MNVIEQPATDEPARINVELTNAQYSLVMRIVHQGGLGSNAANVLKQTLRNHADHIHSGGSVYARGGRRIIKVKRPKYGAEKLKYRVPAAMGKAIPVLAGEVLRISQVEGGQCVDFNAYNLDDYKEYLDCGMNRMLGVDTGAGTLVWTGSARGRPMYVILSMSETCDQYYSGHHCHGLMYESEYALPAHPNCQDGFAEAIREYGLSPDDTHDSYNFWMTSELDSDGNRIFPWNRGRSEDYVDLLALFDTLAVSVSCAGDLNSVNNYKVAPVDLTVFARSDETANLVEYLGGELRFQNQRHPEHVKQPIKAERRLTADPSYTANYKPLGDAEAVAVELTKDEVEACASLLETGLYGDTLASCLVVSFCRWYELNRIPNRYFSLEFY